MSMSRLFPCALCVAALLVSLACSAQETSTNRSAPPSSASESANQTPQEAGAQAGAAPAAKQVALAGELQPGQASGSFSAQGETVQLKYSYAGRAERFGSESLIVLVTDQPIPPEAVAEEIKSTPLLESEQIRGLEYVIDETSMWVRYHPSQYQQSSSNKLKGYKVENNIVRAVDEDDGDLSGGKYPRSVKFAATIVK